MDLIEILGYMASLMVAASFTMKNVLKLRIINSVGCALFSIYGFLIGAIPVGVINGGILIINFYYIYKMKRTRDYLNLMSIPKNERFVLQRFLELYNKDIQKFVPDFKWSDDYEAIFMLRNLAPVGLFAYKVKSDKEIEIHLDYIIPNFRDLKNSTYLFEILTGRGYKEFTAQAFVPVHSKYLLEMGFVRSEKDPSIFQKKFS